MEFPKMTFAQVFITHRCQLACKYCYEDFKDTEDMSYETLIKIVDYIRDNAKLEKKIPTISFFGGEPLLKFDDLIKPCVEYIRQKDKEEHVLPTKITITTNGLCLSEGMLDFFNKNGVRFMLSFDGCKLAEDATRCYKDGTSCFEEIDSKFELITKYNPNSQVRITVDPANIKYLYDSILYLTEKNVSEIRLFPNVFTQWSDEDYNNLYEQLNLIKEHYIKTFNDYEIPLIPKEFSTMLLYRVLRDYSEENNLFRSIPSCNRCNRCGGGFNGNIYVDVDGSIYTCSHIDFTPNKENIFYLGNIYNENKIDNLKVENLLNLNMAADMYSDEDCKACPLNLICIGSCTPNNYLVNGDFNKATTVYCKWTKAIYNMMSELAEHFDELKDNILFKDYFYGAVVRYDR